MTTRTVVLKNNTQVEKNWLRTFAPGEEYTIPTDNSLINKYSVLEVVLIAIANGDASIGNGTIFLTTVSDQLNWLKGFEQPIDADTGGLKLTPKYAPDNWSQQYFETEFETSKIGSIHEKDWHNADIGFSSLKFYDENDDELVKGAQSDAEWQAVLDTDCLRTDLLWMPDHDYAIKSGFIAQKSVPSESIYIWALGADLPEAYGGPQVVFAEGGLNLAFVDARTRSGLDGVSATILYYENPQLGAGMGTNRIRFVVRHSAGFKHKLQAVFEIFIE